MTRRSRSFDGLLRDVKHRARVTKTVDQCTLVTLREATVKLNAAYDALAAAEHALDRSACDSKATDRLRRLIRGRRSSVYGLRNSSEFLYERVLSLVGSEKE